MHTGPNIERDGLVFGYDTGYGVVNNISNSRFNKGTPTVNYIPSPFNYSLYAYASGPVDTTTLNERGKVINVKRYTVTQAVNTARAAIFPTGLTTGTAYTFSFKWKYNGSITSSPTVGVNASKGNPEGGANNNSFTSETANTISLGGGWYLTTYTFTFASVPTGKAMLTFGLNTGSTAGFVNETFDIYEAQFEVKSFKSPYTAGTRSSTQSLIDLTKTSTIDVSNVSFDSTGQPTFDGTDDTISINSYSAIELVDNVSIEYIYKRLSTDPILDVIANKYHSTGWELFCRTNNTFALAGRNGDGTYYSTSNAAYTIQNNIYYHLVAMKEGLSWRLYVNGVLYAYLTANSVGTWSNTGVLQIGGEGSGYYPNMELPVLKIYNKVLSTQEVQQNYRAYKNRFNI